MGIALGFEWADGPDSGYRGGGCGVLRRASIAEYLAKDGPLDPFVAHAPWESEAKNSVWTKVNDGSRISATS
jgi:hypothetical protein